MVFRAHFPIHALFWLSLLLPGQVVLSAQTSVGVTEVTPNLLVFWCFAT